MKREYDFSRGERGKLYRQGVRLNWAVHRSSFFPLLLLALAASPAGAGDRPLELTDLMKLRTIQAPVISKDGAWVAYALVPDRGDGEVVVQSADGRVAHRIERGSAPVVSAGSAWVAALVQPTLEEREKAAKSGGKKNGGNKEDPPRTGLALLATSDGEVTSFEKVESFAFSADGKWLAYQRFKEKASTEAAGEEAASEEPTGEGAAGEARGEAPGGEEPGGEPGEEKKSLEEKPPETPEKEEKTPDEELGATLVLRRLAGGEETEIPHVTAFVFAPSSPYLAYAVSAPQGEGNGLFLLSLTDQRAPAQALHQEVRGHYGALAWAREVPSLAFVTWAEEDHRRWEPAPAAVWTWQGPSGPPPAGETPAGEASAGARQIVASADAPEGWYLPAENPLTWCRDGERLFFGFKPVAERREKEAAKGGEAEGGATEDGDGAPAEPFDPYDLEAILEGRKLDVWHGDDPLIIPHQKERWKEEKNRVYTAVYHADSGTVVPLADRTVREIRSNQSSRSALGLADVPYLKEITWNGRYQDVYRVDLRTGARQPVTEHLRDDVSLSPDGRYVVYYRSPHWYLFDGESGETRNLTAGLAVPFADEDHDYPASAPSYRIADWVEGDGSVLIYDKFDLWRFPTDGGAPVNLTAGEGRRRRIRFRLLDLDPERDFIRPGEELLLSAYHDRDKSWGFYRAREGETGVAPLLEEEKKLTFLAKAEEAPRLLYTRESYTEFPDLWVAGPDLDGRRRLSRANPDLDQYAWGEAELVEWEGADGEPLQGVLIKPGDYQPGRRYPVLVYFYRFFSQRLYEFNEPVVNHRPSFPVYASHGYALFLPDIRFEVGRPGLAAVKALVSGVQKLVEMGVADPERIGLHGHSWSGYQAAYVVTQTHLFAAAVAGAPVANMTSAYSGIRWGSGLARQFQYEQGQSRIGASLWEARDRYVENSPVFYADRIETPLLIEFGDEDGAVPWYQGIELYLALRRLDKEVIFLQYRGEPHHLKEYANKLDYSIKMREFFDHYLKDAPAPAWMTEGVPYRGE